MTTMAIATARGQTWTLLAVGAGLLLGLAYTLSPLTVLSLAAVVWASRAAGRDLPEAERRWFWCLLSAAVLMRLAAIAWLFLTADSSRPFASFFGDEELYKFRTVWLRNVGQGLPMSPADVIYSFDDVGHTSYIYVLAFVQAIVGDAPYGLHLMNMALYIVGVLAIYRFVRPAYGGVVALAGLIALLFMPSLMVWSISVLKEPMNVFMLVGQVMGAVFIVRAPRWWQKALAVLGVAGLGLAMESLRGGGLLTAVVGTAGGLFLTLVLSKGRRLAYALLLAPIAIAMLASSSAVQERVMANLRAAAYYHAGHVLTPGFSYQLVDPRYYGERVQLLRSMPPVDAGRFAVRAVWSYFAEPLVWKTESRLAVADLPEQFVWYHMVLMLPFGVLAGFRRDLLLTSMLVAHATAAIVLVALTSGNIGTLIRHRALALPYLVWLSVLGARECVRVLVGRYRVRVEGSGVDGDR